MGFIVRLLIALVGLVAGVVMIKYNYQLTRLFGTNDYAERIWGAGGTYSMWKLLGVVAIVGAVIFLVA